MRLGQLSLLRLVIIIILCSSPFSSSFAKEELLSTDQIKERVLEEDWKGLLKKTHETKDPLYQVIRARSFYEIGAFNEVLDLKPLNESEPLYQPYFQYLTGRSLFEKEHWQKVIDFKIPRDLANPLKDRLRLQVPLAYKKLGQIEKAIHSYEEFLKERRHSQFKIDVYFELADLYWSNKQQAKALPLYQKIYEIYPLTDRDDLARDKLIETGHIRKVETDAHLSRIQRLRRAALFERGVNELEKLKDSVDKKDLNKINLALAYMHFSQKKYTSTQKMAERFLKRKDIDEKMRIHWLDLLGQSLARQGKFDKARIEYKKLLELSISSNLKQRIYLRLGLMSVDDGTFDDAETNFKVLRTKYRRGNYNETSHWFEAWSIYQQEIAKVKEGKPIDSKRISQAVRLLERLPKLKEGIRFKPQALYWQYRFAKLDNNETLQKKSAREMSESWHTNFYALLMQTNPFLFLKEKRIHNSAANLLSLDRAKPLFDHPYWKRSEAFTLVGLHDWAKLELDRYLYISRKSSKKIKKIVAQKLYYLQEWDSLVHWAGLSFSESLQDFKTDDQEIIFFYPNVYPKQVRAASKRFDVPPYLIWGLMREESRFDYDVVSPAGAVGLMQLMPSLGQQISRRLGEVSTGRNRLKIPDVNIRFGTYHLSTLLKRVDKLDVSNELKPILVVASYNAGFNTVRRWTKELDTKDIGKFVESIPYTETRQYVKRVLRSTYVYYRLYGENSAEAITKSESKL